MKNKILVFDKKIDKFQSKLLNENKCSIWPGDVSDLMDKTVSSGLFDLVVTSPPYNIGKEYEQRKDLQFYLEDQEKIIKQLVANLKSTGSICWQVGNYVSKDQILPLDILFHPIFERLGMKLRNRIIWHYGHGMHAKNRLSGRYEVIMWYTKSDKYTWNLDDVRVPQKYPKKLSYRGEKKGKLSGHPLGKNPADVWAIPNVVGNHVEKTNHPCQFPVALVDRLVKAMTNEGDLVFDPFMGSGSAGVAALINNRRFLGAEIHKPYITEAKKRLQLALKDKAPIRKDKEIYDHKKSYLSETPKEFKIAQKKYRSSKIIKK